MMENFRMELPKFSWKGQQGKLNFVVYIFLISYKLWNIFQMLIFFLQVNFLVR